MIERVVRMEFKKELTDDFLELFHSTKDKIRSFPGCMHLELWQDPHDSSIFMTYSKWESEESLESYRSSPLFSKVWKKTKSMFTEKAIAFSGKNIL